MYLCVHTLAGVPADVYFSVIPDLLTGIKMQKNSGTFFILWDFSMVKEQGLEEKGSEGLGSYSDKIKSEQSGIVYFIWSNFRHLFLRISSKFTSTL